MAAISTKATSRNTQAIRDGKNGSENMPLPTPQDAATPIPTLKDVAQNLVAMELDLKEAQTNGLRWKLMAYRASTGKIGLVAFLYHPDYSMGVENLGDNNLVVLIEGERASAVATRKDAK